MAQATVRELTINVDGEASLLLPPERAVLRVEVFRRSTEADESTNDAIAAARQVEAILRERHQEGTLDYWSRNSLSQENHQQYLPTQQLPDPKIQYTSRVKFTMHVQQFQRLGPLLAELVAIDHVQSEGVQWILTPRTQEAQHSQLRVRAAENARQKAGDYAKALGYVDIWAVEVEDSASHTRPTTMKGQVIRRPTETVKTTPRNLGEEWVDAGEEAFQYCPEDVNMTQSVRVQFLAR